MAAPESVRIFATESAWAGRKAIAKDSLNYSLSADGYTFLVTIVKWNGTAWVTQVSGSTQTLNGIWGADTSNVWAVGAAGTILGWNGTLWAPQTSTTTQVLNSVWAADANNVWAVGNIGTIVKWSGTAWAAQNSGAAQNAAGVGGTGASNLWAVGVGGMIVHKAE